MPYGVFALTNEPASVTTCTSLPMPAQSLAETDTGECGTRKHNMWERVAGRPFRCREECYCVGGRWNGKQIRMQS